MSHAGAVAVLLLPVLGALLAAWVQLRAAARRSRLLLEDLMLAVAWAFPVGAAFWLEAWLSDSSRLGFGAPWTWLTASHFMAAGFGALTVSAWMTRTIPTPRARRVMHGLLLLHPFAFAGVAAGLAGVPFFDEVGAVLYEALFAIQAVLYLVAARPRGPRLARALLGVALWVPVATLLPAMAWAMGHALCSMDEMVAYRGLVNAAGHVGLGLAMLAWLRPPRRLPAVDAPFSRLHSPGRVDASVLGNASREVSGLTDSLRAYSRPGFDTDRLPPEVVAFYEHTTDFELDLHGRWHGLFVVGGWIWSRILSLSSRPDRNPGGEQGVYLVRGGRPWRLPLDETIAVYTAEHAPADLPAAEGSTLVARHQMWLASIPYLTMHYQIRRRPPT